MAEENYETDIVPLEKRILRILIKYGGLFAVVIILLETFFNSMVIEPKSMDQLKKSSGIFFYKHAKGKISYGRILLKDVNGNEIISVTPGPCNLGGVIKWDQFNNHDAIIWYYQDRFNGNEAYQIKVDNQIVCSLDEANNNIPKILYKVNKYNFFIRIGLYPFMAVILFGYGFYEYKHRG